MTFTHEEITTLWQKSELTFSPTVIKARVVLSMIIILAPGMPVMLTEFSTQAMHVWIAVAIVYLPYTMITWIASSLLTYPKRKKNTWQRVAILALSGHEAFSLLIWLLSVLAFALLFSVYIPFNTTFITACIWGILGIACLVFWRRVRAHLKYGLPLFSEREMRWMASIGSGGILVFATAVSRTPYAPIGGSGLGIMCSIVILPYTIESLCKIGILGSDFLQNKGK